MNEYKDEHPSLEDAVRLHKKYGPKGPDDVYWEERLAEGLKSEGYTDSVVAEMLEDGRAADTAGTAAAERVHREILDTHSKWTREGTSSAKDLVGLHASSQKALRALYPSL